MYSRPIQRLRNLGMFATALLLACPFIKAADEKPKPPSARESREINKHRKLREIPDLHYAQQQRKYFNESSVVGRPIGPVVQEWGASTRVVDDGAGGKIYCYDQSFSGQTGKYVPGYEVTNGYGQVLERRDAVDTRASFHQVLYKDLYVNADGIITRLVTGSRNVGPENREFMAVVRRTKIALPGKTSAQIATLVRTYAQRKGFTLKADWPDHIVYRDFSHYGDAKDFGADLYGKVRVTVAFSEGMAEVKLEVETFSTISGAKLIINANDDVASENDVPFNSHPLTAPDKARKAYPEALYDAKGRLINPAVNQHMGKFYDSYIEDLRAALTAK